MPLEPHQRASLTLRIAAARHLDDNASPISQTEGQVLELARQKLSTRRASSCLDPNVARHLKEAASDLSTLLNSSHLQPDHLAHKMIDAAASELDISQCANCVAQGQGEVNTPGFINCRCGFLDLAGMVEQKISKKYIDAGAWAIDSQPKVSYRTAIIEDAMGNLSPFKTGGETDIRSIPGIVTLTLKDCDLLSTDLCHLFYLIHHELICHAFQGNSHSARRTNAPARCPWSEGWMDVLAYELTISWVAGYASSGNWLPNGGSPVQVALRGYHDARYERGYNDARHENPRGLLGTDAKLRRAARVAFYALGAAFLENGFAKSKADADELVHRFSLVANGHTEAQHEILGDICAYLQTSLLSRPRSYATGKTVDLCHQFLKNRDLRWLLAELREASRQSPTQ
jgi:hypothetical protein